MKRSIIALFALSAITLLAQDGDHVELQLDTTRRDTHQLMVLRRVAHDVSGEERMWPYLKHMGSLVEEFSRSSDNGLRASAEKARPEYLLWKARVALGQRDLKLAARQLDQVGILATEAHDTLLLLIQGRELCALYHALRDTLREVHCAKEVANIALRFGDSTTTLDAMVGAARLDTSKAFMRSVLAFADAGAGRLRGDDLAYHYWTKGWLLLAHGYHEEAIDHLIRADTMYDPENELRAMNLWSLGEAYLGVGRYESAVAAMRSSMELSDKHGRKSWYAGAARDLGIAYQRMGNLRAAEDAWRTSMTKAQSIGNARYELASLGYLRRLLLDQRRFADASPITERWLVVQEEEQHAEAAKELMRLDFDTEQRADSLVHAQEQEAASFRLERERTNRNLLLAGAVIAIIFGAISYRQRRRTQKALKRSDELLLNILPEEVAEELKSKGEAEAVQLEHVTVLFTDFKGFTAMSEVVTPRQLVHDLHECFSAFDRVCEKHGIEKIKTIGDAYMAAGGLPTPNTTHATDVINAALEMRDFIAEGKSRKIAAGLPYFEIRIGIHTGPVVAGIVGVKKFQYDIWGDTVNTASRMESSGEVGHVNISEATYALVKDATGLTFTPRGKVQAKGKGEMEMYFVEPNGTGA